MPINEFKRDKKRLLKTLEKTIELSKTMAVYMLNEQEIKRRQGGKDKELDIIENNLNRLCIYAFALRDILNDAKFITCLSDFSYKKPQDLAFNSEINIHLSREEDFVHYWEKTHRK